MKQSKINICGIGPGHPDYILPIVYSLVKNSTVIIGGERHLQIFHCENKETIAIKNNLNDIIARLKDRQIETITILVSGDTGFHSLLHFLKKHFESEELNVIPGISSFQYLFSRLALSYEHARLDSVHGQESNYLELIDQYEFVFLLTSPKYDVKKIASELYNQNKHNYTIHIGNRLSYHDEEILSLSVEEAKQLNKPYELCSVIIQKQIKP